MPPVTDEMLAALQARKKTEAEMQSLHEHRMATEPDHDVSSCWCCCLDCPEVDHVWAEINP